MDVCKSFFFEGKGAHLDRHIRTHSFPTRRSSDRDLRIPLPQPGQKKCSEFLADIRQRPWHGGNNAGIKTSDMIVEAAVRNACLAETFIRRDQVSEAFLVGTKRWHDRFAGEKVGEIGRAHV